LPPPLVSIIVPSYNQGQFIGATLESIFSQDYRPLEVIVIDGASTDETVSVLESYSDRPELQWVSEPDSGVVEAVNKGFARATGTFCGIQSSDDVYLPGAIRTGVEALQDKDKPGFVYGDIEKIDAEGELLSRSQLCEFSIENVLSMKTWIPQPSTFFRLDLAKRLGGWRDLAPYAADTDLWYRMMFEAPARKLDSVMAQRRQHGEQRDVHGDRIIRDYSLMLDHNEALQEGPSRYRRAAKAGCLLMANRYSNGGEGYWTPYLRRLRATLLWPELLRRTPWQALVPGLWPLRRAVAKILKRGNSEKLN